jgi:hypothetical protein
LFTLLEANWGDEKGIVTRKKKKVVETGVDSESDAEPEAQTNKKISNNERVLTTDRFEKQFGYESVIDTYCRLLVNFENISNETLNQIIVMFNRIMDPEKCDKEPLFYEVF